MAGNPDVPRAAMPESPEGTPITIVIPCFDEEPVLENLARVLQELKAVFEPRYRVCYVLVDDGSKDGTWELMQRLFSGWPHCSFCRHPRNRGIAAAIMTGLREARTEIVCSMDSDCTYDPRQLLPMLPMLRPGVDVVTASPYHPDGGVRGVPPWRLVLSRGLSRLYRLLLRHKLHTYTSCFRVYRRSRFLSLSLRHDGFLGVAEMLGRLDLAGGTIVECPAVLTSRVAGRSKMKTVRTIFGHLGLLAELTMARLRPGTDRPGTRSA
ncbi:MAG: glycosyltransferase family 2 protein [Candidatus Wallbacteria bacterium]|nr:glycosyltransferase family 2 protein [Candidatus Wallbacteria bacterium]